MEAKDIKLTKLAKCAGCGAKVGAGVLAKLLEGIRVHHDPNLLVGFDKSDDASVYKISDELALVQTVDFFPPIADDPYLFGQIAATNALSDVYAMGGEPKLCLNIMAIPESMPMEAVHALLRGGYDKVYEAGALITGGHSIHDDEPKYGLAVTGFVHPDKILTNSGAKPGDVLLLTKPIGIGVLSTAKKVDMLSAARMLQKKGYKLFATGGSSKFLTENGVENTCVYWPSEPDMQPQALDMLHKKEIDMVVNIPKNLPAGELDNGYKIRRAAIDLNIPLITNAPLASAFINAFCTMTPDDLAIKSWEEYR